MTDPKLAPNRAPNGGKGRPKGAKNKLTQSAKEAFEAAFDSLGGAEALAYWARSNETDFYKLFARLIPVDTRIGDTNGDPISIKVTFPSAG